MKKILYLSLVLLSFQSTAQTYPAYNITALDSNRSEGYYFFCALLFGTTSPQYPVQFILDRYGRPVYFRKTFGAGSDFKLLPNGLMSFNAQQRFYWKDSSFTLVDSVTTKNGIVMDAHDIRVLPNGHILLLGTETITMDLSSYNMFNHNGSPGNAAAQVKCGVIQELDAVRNVVFEWHAKDYYSFGDVDEEFLNSPINVDWTHFNAVDLDTDGNILVSSRHFNEITKISRTDSTILWRLGGKMNQFTFVNDTAMFVGQHDCRRIANGHITLYDDGRDTPLHPATAKEYAVNELTYTATLAWSYTENAGSWSNATGNVQRLDNGNTLTNYGNLTNANVMFNVVDSLGTKVFEISFPDTAASYNAFNYATLPWPLPRPVITCDSATATLDAGPGFSSYLWSTGATTRTITVTSAGTYWAQVRLSDGGYIRSEYMEIVNPASPCLVTGIAEPASPSLTVYPNPATEKLHVVHGRQSIGTNLSVSDATGRICITAPLDDLTEETVIDVVGLKPGVYFVRFGNCVQRFIR